MPGRMEFEFELGSTRKGRLATTARLCEFWS